MDVVFFGSGAFGVPTLEHLSRSHTLRGIVTQPDRPAGRGGELTPTPVGAWAATHRPDVALLKPEKCNAADVTAQIRGWPAEAWVVIAFGQKLGKALLAERFAINLHASLLPRWRGAAPINAALLAGDARTGNSVITLAERMDAGLVLGQSELTPAPEMTAGEAHDRLSAEGPALVQRVLEGHAAGRLSPAAQDEALVTIAPKLSRADGWVDFQEAAEQCRRRINGLSPWPGVTVQFRGAPLKLVRATVDAAAQASSGPAGAIQGAGKGVGEGLVACGVGTLLRLLEVQAPGKRVQAWRDFANGARVNAQEVLTGGRPC